MHCHPERPERSGGSRRTCGCFSNREPVTAPRFHSSAVREPSGSAVGASKPGSCCLKLSAHNARSWALRSRHARLHCARMQSQRLRIFSLRRTSAVSNQSLLLVVSLDQRDCSSQRPVSRRYRNVSASTGKMPQVAPYSGAIAPNRLARSAKDKSATPGPKNSTNFPTTPSLRSAWVTPSAPNPSQSLPRAAFGHL